MSGLSDWLQVVAVPLLGVLGRLAWPTLSRRVKRHVELLKETPEELRTPLEELITYELTVLRDRELAKADRRIVWPTAAALVFVLAVGAVGFWLLWRPDNVVLNSLGIAVGALTVMLALAGVSTVWESPAAAEERRKRSAQKKLNKERKRQGK